MKLIRFTLLPILFLCSCEKLLFEEDLASSNPMDNFEYLWNECNEKYAYFELKNIDWNQVRATYSPKIHEGMTEDSLFTVLGEMLTELRDDHANLFSDFNVSFYGVAYLAQDNFDWRIIVDHYLAQDYYISGPFRHNFLENGQIGYIRLASFTGTIEDEHLNFILTRYKDTKGLILDIRENGGGKIANVFTILSRFVDTASLVNYSVIKTGPGHNEFSEPEPVMIQPFNGVRYSQQVAVLTDRGTYSSGSLLALATKALPNLFMVGDTTGGGLGMPNGGQLPNGWTYRFSVTQSLTLDQKPDFEQGVPPDITIPFNWDNLTNDEILDRAILELL